jgi:hypothetical protein
MSVNKEKEELIKYIRTYLPSIIDLETYSVFSLEIFKKLIDDKQKNKKKSEYDNSNITSNSFKQP